MGMSFGKGKSVMKPRADNAFFFFFFLIMPFLNGP